MHGLQVVIVESIQTQAWSELSVMPEYLLQISRQDVATVRNSITQHYLLQQEKRPEALSIYNPTPSCYYRVWVL